ncbi:MAG: methyltransferase [Candidatus Micrarchaeota archaeon]|nr:methyltransferase [Candidatus Micrarchaeota archaeon]MDE1851040.1 methyltransferase [Candidatus Micrarchaeota archaeon]
MLEFGGLRIRTDKRVYEPRDDTFLAAMVIESVLHKMKKEGIAVLDMGTGTGLLGITAAKYANVASVTFADINRKALDMAKGNYKLNRALVGAKAKFLLTDLFEKVKGRFDLVIFNAPYLPGEDDGRRVALSETWNGGREGIETCIRFVEGLDAHLNGGGRAILVVSSFANLPKLKKMIRAAGFSSRSVAKKHIFFEDIIVMELRAT